MPDLLREHYHLHGWEFIFIKGYVIYFIKFVANAKPEIVAAEREKLVDLTGQMEKLTAAVERLNQAG